MKIKQDKKEKKKKEEKPEEGVSVEGLLEALNLQQHKLQENFGALDNYPLKPPFSYALIVQDKNTSELSYFVDEIPMSREEQEASTELRKILESRLQAPQEGESPAASFQRQFPDIVAECPRAMEGITSVGARKISYYLERDVAGFGRIDPIMSDPNIEDISCNGASKPVYLWHRKYENIRTNISFADEEELDDFVMKLVHKAGKHISLAFPVVDATLPGKHRLAVYYKKEVTPLGTSFTIRKFREDPLTIIDLIQNETISPELAAYLWLLVENKFSSMIIGATGAGKTTSLNAVAGLVHPQHKIITVEEVSEINLLRENWVSTISRSGFGAESSGEVPLFDLIKAAVRHRPDWVIVGEVRGEEAYVLFQALATGHGGLCTMHAEDAETAIKRLTQPPMNIPATIIPLMHCVVSVKHVKIPVLVEHARNVSKRKFMKVSEIRSSDSIHDVFVWDSSTDTYREDIQNSYIFRQISEKWNLPFDYILKEFERRKTVLERLAEKNIRSCGGIAKFLTKFYSNPELAYKEILESR